MKLIKFLKKSYISAFLAAFVIFVSCEKSDNLNQEEPLLESEQYDQKKMVNYLTSNLIELREFAEKQENMQQLDFFDITQNFLDTKGIDTEFLDGAIDIAEFMNLEDPKEFLSKTNNYTTNELNEAEFLYQDLLLTRNLSKSIKNFENKLNQTSLSFNERNNLENLLTILKAVENHSVSSNLSNISAKSSGSCAWAFVSVGIAFAGLTLATGATVASAGGLAPALVASAGFVVASINTASACKSGGISVQVRSLYSVRRNRRDYKDAIIFNYDDVQINGAFPNLHSSIDLKKLTIFKGRYTTNGIATLFAFKEQYKNELIPFDIFNENNKKIDDIQYVQLVQIGQTAASNLCSSSNFLDCFPEDENETIR